MLARELEGLAPAGRWWPYDDPFEIAVSAVLTQRTTWESAARAMEGLRAAGLLTPPALAAALPALVEARIRGSGFYRQKARALQGIARTLVERFGGRIENAFRLPTDALRRELLSWRGVGEETADAILLYAAARPVFVVDAYTVRLMRRFGALASAKAPPYGTVAAAWRRAAVTTAARSRRLHATIVDFSKATCAAVPRCAQCPIRKPCSRLGVGAGERQR